MGTETARGQAVAIDRLRAYFMASVEDESAIDEAAAYLEGMPAHREPLVDAYAAIFEVMRARHAFWPGKKMEYLKAGLDPLDRLVTAHPDHTEIRYIRLMACYYLPRFLGRSWSVEADFEALARLLPASAASFPAGLYRTMVRFVRESGGLTDAQRRGLDEALAQSEQAARPNGMSTGESAGGF